MVKLNINLSGGLELLFGNKKELTADVPVAKNKQLTIAPLLSWLRQNALTEREELFIKGNSVRPGILVLVNDTDWELSGALDTEVEEGDTVTFISTLHGG
eukprot:jgi/Astpho2/1546/Aster-05417